MKFLLAFYFALVACLSAVVATDATRIVLVPKGMYTEKKALSFCHAWERACRDVAKAHHTHMVADRCNPWSVAPSAYLATHEARVDCIVEGKKGKTYDFTKRAAQHLKLKWAPANKAS